MKLPIMIKVNVGPHKSQILNGVSTNVFNVILQKNCIFHFQNQISILIDFIWLEHKALNAYVHVSFPSIAVLYWKFFNLQSRVKWVVIRCFSRRVCAAIPDSLQVVGVCTGNLQCTQNYLNRDLLWKLMFQYISINMPINRKFG